jgi:hypothetical protein
MKTATNTYQGSGMTIRELRGITTEEFQAAIGAGRKLAAAGEYRAAAEVLAGLALYDPFEPEVWRAIEDLFRRQSQPGPASLFASLSRAMAA